MRRRRCAVVSDNGRYPYTGITTPTGRQAAFDSGLGKRDGDDILFALPKSRRKTVNLNRDPRAALVIFDAASPYESAQVQGTASIEDDPDTMLVDELSYKYTGRAVPRVRRAEPAMGNREDHGRQGHHQLAGLINRGLGAADGCWPLAGGRGVASSDLSRSLSQKGFRRAC
jgi:hypothetical protein